jgi:ribosomal protein L9
MFGSIAEKDIIWEIKKKFKIELQKKHIVMPAGHIKKLWSENIYVKLSEDSMAKIIVNVK